MRAALLILASVALAAAPAAARAPEAAKPGEPVTTRDVSAGDVVATPASDLNLKKGEIPPLLIAAQAQPYALTGLKSCARLAAAVGELDAVLGEDVDLGGVKPDGLSAGRVAQSVVGSFIPFRGVIREISGANEQQRKLQMAVLAGAARRGFLKGVGQQRGCRYPARSASAKDVAAMRALAEPGKDAGTAKASPAPQSPARKRALRHKRKARR